MSGPSGPAAPPGDVTAGGSARGRRGLDRKILLGAVAVLALIVAAVGTTLFDRGGGGDGGDPTLREYAAGERPPAPGISGETLDGGALDLADLRGDVVVVNVWASWCPPCRAETDDLETVYQATRDQGVSFVGVNIRDSRDRATSFVDGRVSYPSIFDPASAYARHFTEPPAPVGPPATLVIDRTGHVAAAIYRIVGPIELQTVVERVAAEVPADG